MVTTIKITEHNGHIGIPVSNIVQSEEFYRNLGFALLEQHKLPAHEGTNYITFMRHGSITIELYQLCDAVPTERKDGAINHFAIRVDNIEKQMQRIQDLGLAPIAPPEYLPFGQNGVTYFMIEGPDKEKVEFDFFH